MKLVSDIRKCRGSELACIISVSLKPFLKHAALQLLCTSDFKRITNDHSFMKINRHLHGPIASWPYREISKTFLCLPTTSYSFNSSCTLLLNHCSDFFASDLLLRNLPGGPADVLREVLTNSSTHSCYVLFSNQFVVQHPCCTHSPTVDKSLPILSYTCFSTFLSCAIRKSITPFTEKFLPSFAHPCTLFQVPVRHIAIIQPCYRSVSSYFIFHHFFFNPSIPHTVDLKDESLFPDRPKCRLPFNYTR